ncbi:hypothetical protein ACFU7T_06225 [Streptomyces sp. NPDC057555]|uniref:hypothetical protein n=1 Tax=Streptomyces sp. NPDC057555 TaxID=3346166 RepID=UPI0036BB52E9
MWSARHTSYLEQTAQAIDDQIQLRRSRERARAAKYSKEQVEQGRKIAHANEVTELERLAALGQIPPAEYKARLAALEEDKAE